jgi:hypothetical protein
MLAGDACRLGRRHMPAIEWLELLHPVIHRVSKSANPVAGKFHRQEAILPGKGWLLEPDAAPEDDFEFAPGRPLPAETRDRLRPLLGAEVDAVRVHDGKLADAVAHEHRADAVTVGRDVYFRRGLFQPGEPAGLALLAHEATHVVEALRPGAAWKRATATGMEQEERKALGRERDLRARRSPAPEPLEMRPDPPVNRGRPAAQPSAQSPATHPMKADIGRSLDAITAGAPGGGMDDMRRTLFRDLLSHIRTEFERGA